MPTFGALLLQPRGDVPGCRSRDLEHYAALGVDCVNRIVSCLDVDHIVSSRIFPSRDAHTAVKWLCVYLIVQSDGFQ